MYLNDVTEYIFKKLLIDRTCGRHQFKICLHMKFLPKWEAVYFCMADWSFFRCLKSTSHKWPGSKKFVEFFPFFAKVCFYKEKISKISQNKLSSLFLLMSCAEWAV